MKTYRYLWFSTREIPGGADAILGPAGCKKDVAKVSAMGTVSIDFEEHDERLAKVLALLKEAGTEPNGWYWDEYTEEEYQAAPLLLVSEWSSAGMWTVQSLMTYDQSQMCPTCLTGVRQASPLIVDGREMLDANKHRVSSGSHGNLLVRDTDVATLIAANVTGANFWPVTAKYKSGATGEIRWQQAVVENVLPPMAASTDLDDSLKCATCGRGRLRPNSGERRLHITYRREDLENICDFNLSWEWFGPFGAYAEDTSAHGVDGARPYPWVFVTPKVMNLIRGKTKKEQKYQGCGFAPIWIEDDTHDKPYLLT